jgi:hypothetical protein
MLNKETKKLMATRKVLLKEDRSGLDALNYIENESKSIGTGRNRLLVPEYGAFFTENFQLKDEVGTVINRSKYMFCELYQEATRNSGKEVWNSLIILDENLPETLVISYHAYGGKFSANASLLIEWVDEKLSAAVDPIAWSDLVDKPKEFEPAFHYHLWKEVYSFDHLRRPLTNIENAIHLDSSFFFDNLIAQIKQKLIEAEDRAFDIAKFYANKLITEKTVKITKQTLDVHLLANLPIATETEMSDVAKSTFDSTTIVNDKYINKKGLMAFTKVLKDRSVSKEATGLGLFDIKLSEPKRGSILVLGNGAVTTFESKKKIVADGNFYEENVYPKNYPATDRFTVVRVTNNLNNYGGVFLGFNNNTGEMYSGVLKVDTCYKRVEWYRFYSDIAYDSIKEALLEHINAKNNPHKLTKKQVDLEHVVNMPVITAEQILGNEPTDSYITLDALSLFMTKHLLNLKPEFNTDGSLNKDSDLFNKPNIIFTPCDKKPPGTYPDKGLILKAFCLGTDRFQRIADGIGGFTETVLELNSDDCKYFEIQPQGTVLYELCDGTNRLSAIADGRGGSSNILSKVNSEECGFIPPPKKGTVLGTKCEDKDEVTNYADGQGGSFDVITTVNSAKCGYIAPTTRAPVLYPAAGTVLRTKCGTSATGNSFTKFNVVANGSGGSTDEQIAVNSPDCGYAPPPPPESIKGYVLSAGTSAPVQSISATITNGGGGGGGIGSR